MKKFVWVIPFVLVLVVIAFLVYPSWLGNRKMSLILRGDTAVRITEVRFFDGHDELNLDFDSEELKIFEDGLRRSEYKKCGYGFTTLQIRIYFLGGGIYDFQDATFDDGILSVKDFNMKAAEPLWASHWVKFNPDLSLRIQQALRK